MAKDPVCGMDVKEQEAAPTYEYKGKKYYFCAVGCKISSPKLPRSSSEKKKIGRPTEFISIVFEETCSGSDAFVSQGRA